MMLTREEKQLLAEIGFLGISTNRLDEARAIFSMLCSEMPENEAGFVGLALTLMAQGRGYEAQGVLDAAPSSDVTLAFSVLAAVATGATTEARDKLGELETLGPAPHLLTMARAALDDPALAERHIR